MNEIQERIYKELKGYKIEIVRTGDDEENTETVIDWANDQEKSDIAKGIADCVEDYIEKQINSKMKYVKEGIDRIQTVMEEE